MTKTFWQPFNTLLSPPGDALADWLRDPASFMQRLKRHGIHGAKIHVLDQAWKFPTLEERKMLNIPERRYAMVREVLIASKAGAWMFARTVFPASTLTGEEQKFLRLKNRPLGSMLFSDPLMQRSEFHFACLRPGMRWHQKVLQQTALDIQECWARKSVFHIRQKSLLLTEVFLPDIVALKHG